MKIIFTLIILSINLSWASRGYSQTDQLSIKLNDKSVREVFSTLEKESGYRFFYNDDFTYLDKLVSVDAEKQSLNQILNNLFVQTDFDYKILDNKLVVISIKDELLQTKKKVSGKVTDQNGQSLVGVTVLVKGTTHAVLTDANGAYSIQLNDNDKTLVYSFIGMTKQEILINGRSIINLVMATESNALDEVVVIGYGSMKKSDLTGSVTNLSSTKLLDKPAFNIAEAIGGKVAGVKIIENNGAPGAGVTIRIRGTNSINSSNTPLFVVDGVVGVSNALTTLNPNEIESMDVLKDASATAIYGARGSNGVIIITTKRGIAGKTQVEYNAYVTEGVMDRHLYAMNADQFMYVYTQAFMNVNKYATSPNWGACFDASMLPASVLPGATTYSEMPYLFKPVAKGAYEIPLVGRNGQYYAPIFNTNWESETFKPSFSTNQQFNIRGGTDKAKFGAFFNYANEDGLLLNSYFKRYSGKVTGDIKVNKWFDFSTNLTINRSSNRTNDVSYFSGGMSRAATEAYPMLPVKYPSDPTIYGIHANQYGGNADFPCGETPHSPVAISDQVETFTNRDQYTGDVTLNFKITPDLSLKSNFAVDMVAQKYNNYGGIGINTGSSGSADIQTNNSFYWQNEDYFNYAKTIGDHAFTGMLGLSWSKYSDEYVGVSNQYFFDDFYKYHNIGIGTASRPAPSSGDYSNELNSYFGRVNYTYKNKYMFTATGRIDGSSRFGANSKYGFFPSGSVAWRASEEDFIKSIAVISNAKVRASIGQTGNQEIGDYVTQTFIGSTNIVMNGAVTPGLFPNSVGNPDLKWEKTTQYDAGLDLGFFHDRLAITVDYYHKLTTDMLLNVPLPTSTTTGSVYENYGTVENKGIEVLLTTHNIKSKDFNWFSTVTFSANQNTIIKLGPTGADILTNGWVGGANTILRVGQSIGTFFGLTREGVYSTEETSLAARYGLLPGDVKHTDKNNDGAINFVTDGGVLGSAFPKWDMDIINSGNFKNFDFSLDIKISVGGKKENRTNHSGQDRQAMANGKNSILDAWRPDHQNTDIAQVRPGNGGAYYQTYPDTHWIEDASYVRGEGATLGYSLSPSVLRRLGIDKIRIYANTKNFFLITKYTGYDPEGSDNDNMGDGLTPNMDFFMYPRPTTYTLGVNLTF